MTHSSDDFSQIEYRTICPDCGVRVDPDAVRCPACGARFPAMHDREGDPGRAIIRMFLIPFAMVSPFVIVGVLSALLQADSRPGTLEVFGFLALLVVTILLDYWAWLLYRYPDGFP